MTMLILRDVFDPLPTCSLPGRALRNNVPRGGVDPKPARRACPPDNPEIRAEMKTVATKRRRLGYQQIGVLPERKRMIMNHEKLYRLYTKEKLGVINLQPWPTENWSLDHTKHDGKWRRKRDWIRTFRGHFRRCDPVGS